MFGCGAAVQFLFGDCSLDIGRRELRRGKALVEIEPQVFDLLAYLVENRDRVVSKDDIIASIWDGRQRKTTSPENAMRIRLALDAIDVTDLLPQVRVPTLVMHCRDEAAAPFEEGRRMAAGIPGARFVALDGRNHLILKTDPAWDRFIAEINCFLSE